MKPLLKNHIIRYFLIIAGIISVVLGILGIFLPLLPTTPFLLLAAACFIKSSPRLYQWLITHKYFGNYIKNYREGKGIPLKTKIFAICLLWVTIGFSAYTINHLHVRIFLLLIAIGVTFHLIKIKTLESS